MKIDWLIGDDDIVLDEHEARACFAILDAKNSNLVKIVSDAGFTPATFFEDGNWAGVDFRDTDVNGISFARADLSGVILYRDQYKTIRKTKPRTLDKAQVQETRSGGKGDQFTIILDQPKDPAVARVEFKTLVEELVVESQQDKIGRIDWNKATRNLARLDNPSGKIYALNLVLDKFEAMPGRSFVDACLMGIKLDHIISSTGWSPAVDFLHVTLLETDDARINLLRTRLNARAFIDDHVVRKVIELGRTVDLLRRVVDLYLSCGQRLSGAVFAHAQAKLARSIVGAKEVLAQMERSGVRADNAFFRIAAGLVRKNEEISELLTLMAQADVRPDPVVFNNMFRFAKTIDEVRQCLALMKSERVPPDPSLFAGMARVIKTIEGVGSFLALMRNEGVPPNPAVFAAMAHVAKTIEGGRQFLDLMTGAGVRPDPAVFAVLAKEVSGIEEIPQFLALMTGAGVRPDPAVFAVMAEEASTIDQVRQILALMAEADVSPDHRHFASFLEACRTMSEASEFLINLERVGKKPANKHLNKFLDNVHDHLEAEKIWALFARYELTPDYITWGTITKKMPDWSSAWEVYISRRPVKAAHTGAVLNPLLYKARARNDLRMTLEEFERRRVNFDFHSIKALLSAELSDADVVWALNWMRQHGLNLDAIDQAQLKEGAERFNNLKGSL